MAGMFDDLIPQQPVAASASVQPVGAPAGGMFDDLIPQAAPTASALTVHGSPQSAGDALDMVEGTGTAAYDTGAPENGATIGDRARNLGGMAVAALDGAANAVPFTDRLAAAAAAATGLGGKFGDYSGNLAQLRGEEGAAMAAHPNAAVAGGLVGGAAVPVPALGAVANGVTLGGKVVRGMAAGGLLGAASGASSSQDLTDIGQTAKDVGIGAGVGGFVGGALPVLAQGAGAAARLIKGDSVPNIPGVNPAARDIYLSAIAKDGAENVARNAQIYGDPAMLFDYGTGLRGVAEGLATKDGAAASTIGDALGYRQAATNARVRAGLDQNFGAAQDPAAVAGTITDAEQAATGPLLARAAQAGVPYPAELAQRPAVASALRDVAKDAANRGTPLPTVTLDEAGNPVASDAAIQAYEAGQRPAVTGALANMLGADSAVGPLATQSALTIQRKAASDPLYEAYRQMSVPMTSDLADVLNRPSVRSALAQAERKAQDEGESIFAPRARRFEDDPLGSGNTPEPPIDLENLPPFQAEQAPSRPPPVGTPRPPDLHEFIRSAGGVRDPGGDLAAMGHDNLIAPAGRGLSPDQMRQAAAQAGYLGAHIDDATAHTTINDLFGAIGSDNPIHSVFDQDAAAAWAARDAAMGEFNRGGVPRGEVGRDAGPRPMAPGMPFGGPDAPTGPATRAPQITPKGLDLVKRALQDKADIARRNGSNDDARIFGNLKDELLGAIESHPDSSIADAYGAARQAYAGPSREIDALNAGRAAFGDNVTAEQVQREYAALATDGERQRYRQGMFAAGSQKLSKAGDTSNFVRTVAGNQTLRDKFAAVVPHQGALDTFNGHVARAQQQFTQAQRPTPGAWQQALAALDARAAKGEPGIAAARDALAAHMGQNPDFARARGIQQDYSGLRDAIDYGRQSLASGGDPVWPQAYAQRLSGMSPAGVAANRVGQRATMEEAVGLAPNDQLAIKRLFQTGSTPGYTAPGAGPGSPDLSGWNAQKLATSFGHEPVARMQELLNANDAFNQTFNSVANNSRTARREAMKEALSDAEWKPRDVMDARSDHATGLGLVKQGVAKTVNALAHALQGAPSTAARDIDLARLGTLTGADRDAVVRDLFDRLPAYQGREQVDDATRRNALRLAAVLSGAVTLPNSKSSSDPKTLAKALRQGAQR